MNSPVDPDEERDRQKPSWLGLAGIAIGLVGLGFALYALARAWDGLKGLEPVPWKLALAALVGIAGMATIGLNWIRIIRLKGASVQPREGMRWYFFGQLGKYIPGAVWAVLGRAELATRGGVARATAYASVGVSLATTYAAAATVGATLLAVGASSLQTRLLWTVLSVATVVGAVLVLTEPVVRRIGRLARRFRITAELPATAPKSALAAIALTLPAWVCIGAATGLVGGAVGFEVDVAQVIAATAYSWLAGFLVVPTPGGLGVREAVFIAIYSGSTEEAAVVAVAARVLFILVDLTGAATFTAVQRLVRRR